MGMQNILKLFLYADLYLSTFRRTDIPVRYYSREHLKSSEQYSSFAQ